MSNLFAPFSVEPRFLAVIATHDQGVLELLQRDFAATIIVPLGESCRKPGSNLSQTLSDAPEQSGEHSILTPRQLQILHLLKEGLINKQIGRALQLSHFTVRNHVSCIFKAVGVHSRRALQTLIALDSDH